MPRIGKVHIGERVYHIINRSNARVQIFDTIGDYQQFETILNDAVSKYAMRLSAYCVMPNHWHLVLHTRNDGYLGLFMGWISNTHTRRWHTAKNVIGHGHLYQCRINPSCASKTAIPLHWCIALKEMRKKRTLFKMRKTGDGQVFGGESMDARSRKKYYQYGQ